MSANDQALRAAHAAGIEKLVITVDVAAACAAAEEATGGNHIMAQTSTKGGARTVYAAKIEDVITQLADSIARHPIPPQHDGTHDGVDPTQADRDHVTKAQAPVKLSVVETAEERKQRLEAEAPPNGVPTSRLLGDGSDDGES